MRGDCNCPVLEYRVSQVTDDPTRLGQIDHLYGCRKCGWTTSFPEYKGRRINREEDG